MTDAASTAPDLNGLLGLDHFDISPDHARVVWTIGSQHLQPHGIPHGGVYCAAHEAVASVAGVAWVNRDAADGDLVGIAVGMNNSTDFLRQAKVGDTITTSAAPIHRGRTQQLWRVESVDQNGKLIAQGQVRLANLPAAGTR
jgi:1,4-dihydroxy-2-naphthoyl-CoA hydrolase